MVINDTILKFSKFLDYYNKNYGKPSSEISISDNKKEPLVKSDYNMLDFDSMCRDAEFYPKENKEVCNRPSTVDALYYRLNEEILEFYLVEFKSFYFNWDSAKNYNSSLNKVLNKLNEIDEIDSITRIGMKQLENIRDNYGSTIEFSLRLKPYESLFVVLPKIYDEYCQKENITDDEKLDLYNFFKSDLCEIKLIIVGKKNPKGDLSKANLGKLGKLLEKQYRRLDYVNVLTKHRYRECFEWEFDLITLNLNKTEKKYIKTLNKA